MADLFDAAISRAAKEKALAQVADNAGDFMTRGMAAIAAIPSGFEGIGEKIRTHLLDQGIAPHHQNAWGALISGAIRRGVLTETGRYEAMTAKKSHARKTQVLRRP